MARPRRTSSSGEEELGMGEVVAAAGRDVDRHVADDPDAALGRVGAQRRPLALEPHLLLDRAVAGERRPVGEPGRLPVTERASLARLDRALRIGEQPAPGRERRRRRVGRADGVGRIERQHLPPRGAGRREPVDEGVRLRAEPAARERRRMELHARVSGRAASRGLFTVSRHVPADRIIISRRDAAGRLRPLAGQGVRRRRASRSRRPSSRDGHEIAARGRPAPPRPRPLARGAARSRSAPTASRARSTVEETGRYRFEVVAWVDRYAGWLDEYDRKVAAGQEDLAGELSEGAVALRRGLGRGVARGGRRARRPATGTARAGARRSRSRSSGSARGRAPGTSCSRAHGAASPASTAVVPELAELGFDVVYLPPIHPIGRTNRKGPNNAERAEPGDPGSPWAIGGRRGRARRDPSGARLGGGARRPRRGAARARDGARARPRPPVRSRPSVAPRPPRLVPAAPRRVDQVRGEPAQALPGHPQPRLGHGRPRGALAGGAATSCCTGAGWGSRCTASTTRTRSPSRSGSG